MNMAKNMSIKNFICVLFLCFFSVSWAQKADVKTNLLYDATATVNLGAEFKLAPRWSLDVSGDFNGWTINRHKWKHWFAQPEARYWFCEAFVKHFVGLHAIGGQYNVGNISGLPNFLGSDFSKLSHERYQGNGVGVGLVYGYALPLSRNWNMEFEIGLGYVYLDYDIYECQDCGRKVGEKSHNYVGPTKAAINLVYVF